MLREDEHAYRERMEAFVSDLTGTTMAELVLVSIPIPMGIWLLGEAKVRLVFLIDSNLMLLNIRTEQREDVICICTDAHT